jgi:hypothetical protein
MTNSKSIAPAFLAAVITLASPAAVHGQGRFDDYERTPLFDAPPVGGAVGYGIIFGRRGINEDGEWLLNDVIQVYPTLGVAAVWSNGQVRHPFGTAESSLPIAINRRGTVVAGRSSNTLIAERSGRITTVAGRFPVTVNNDDEVLLYGFTGASPSKAWIRNLVTGHERELSAIEQAYGSFFVTDMNDEGDVVGFVADRQGAGWVRGRDVFVLWHDAAAPSIVATLPGSRGSIAYVNNARQIVVGEGAYPYSRAYFWENGQLTELAPNIDWVDVWDFTDAGDVLLLAHNGLPYPSHVYRNGRRDSLQPLVGPGGATLFVDIQEDGTVYGYDVCPAPGPCRNFFFRATPRDRPITDLLAYVSGYRVFLSWSLPIGAPPATGYVIEASNVPGGPPVVTLDTGTTATTYSTLAPAGTRYVRVRARRATGPGPASNEVEVVVPQLPCQLPAPTGLAFTVTDGNRVTLTWRAVPGATSYYLLAVANHTLYGFDIGPATSYQTFAQPGVYPVTIRARNECAESPGASIEVVVGCPRLSPPTLERPAVTGRSVVFSWSPAPPQNVTYTLEAALRPSSNVLVASFPVLGTTWPTANAPPGTYYVRIKAENRCADIARSNEVEVIVR